MNRFKLWIWLLAAAFILVGLWRLNLDVNVFNLLPDDSRMVEGLRLYQRSFGSQRELIISVRAQDAKMAEAAVQSLARQLDRSELTSRIVWRSPMRGDPAQLAEMLAYVWYNQAPDEFADMGQKLQDANLQQTIDSTLERIATSFRPLDIARLSHDPFALTDLPEHVASPMTGLNKDPFASPAGDFRIMFMAAPFEQGGFWGYRHWVAEVNDAVNQWRQAYAHGSRLKVKMTGAPVFLTHTGSGLMRDMLTAALSTMVLVAGLFWLVHRQWMPLIRLVMLQVFILAATIAVGALVLGPLNAVSLGFAAILLGLAADYALILYQEYIVEPTRAVAAIRSIVAPSILWAASTTAGAFFLIGRSSLPGLTQLGSLVGIGILVAAVVMLAVFLSPLNKHGRTGELRETTARNQKPVRQLKPRAVWIITLFVAVGALFLLNHRLPNLDSSTNNLGPKHNPAKAALDEIQHEIGGFDDVLWVILSGVDEGDVATRLDEITLLLDGAVNDGLLTSYDLPTALWPRPDNQDANRNAVRRLQKWFAAAKKAAISSGFTAESLVLTDEIFRTWNRMADTNGVVRPEHPGSRWIFQQFSGQDADRQLVLGKLEASTDVAQADLSALAGRIDADTGGQVFGWSLLSDSLMTVMQRDIKHVMIPMTIALLLLLGLAFRNVGEILLSIQTLAFSLLCLMSIMVVLGWSWNLMNVMALPLLFGAGVDYSIHIQFALRRCAGDLARVRRTVGSAILLCAASTACGFGTLGMASNAGVASLGRVCAVGILITCITSVYLLPVWWQSLKRGLR